MQVPLTFLGYQNKAWQHIEGKYSGTLKKYYVSEHYRRNLTTKEIKKQ